MKVIALTVFLSVLLAAFFMALFLRSRQRGTLGRSSRDALLPLDEEESPPPPSPRS